jgi:hypothetical protein
VLVFTVMTSVFLAEICQGDRTQGQQSILKLRKVQAKYTRCGTISTYLLAGGQMRAVVYYSARLRKSDNERMRDLRRDEQILPQ